MSGTFYSINDLREPRFIASTVAAVLFSVAAVGLSTFVLYNEKIRFEEIARIEFLRRFDVDPTKVQPISKISDNNENVQFAGYLTNIDEVCKNVRKSSDQILVLAKPDGQFAIGKAKITPKTCELLDTLKRANVELLTATDNSLLPGGKRRFMTIATERPRLNEILN